MKIECLDFNNNEHFAFLNYLINYNKMEFINDNLTGQELLNILAQTPEPIFIVYVDNEPYGIIYAEYSLCKIVTLHACTGSKKNFFVNLKILKYFIKYLFETEKILKIKTEVLVYDNNAEFVARCLGFRKEAILREEIFKNGKPQNMLLLSLTKSEYEKKQHLLTRKQMKNIGELIRNGKTKSVN